MSAAAEPALSPPEEPRVEREVRRIRDLTRGGEHARALRAAEALAATVPENRDVLYALAFSQRHLQDTAAALATLERLERVHPHFSRLHEERGLCYVALRDAPRAIASLLQAVNLNPALPNSWAMLEKLWRIGGDRASADTAAEHVATLGRLAPEVVRATSLFADRDLGPAEALVRARLRHQGDDVEAMRLLARIGIARHVLDDAELLLEAVLDLAPTYRAARHDHAFVLVERHKYREARAQLERLLAEDPRHRGYRALFAATCVGLGEQARAIDLYRELLGETPQSADLLLSLAHVLKTVGDRDAAVAAYRAAAAARPEFGDAYWSLANLKTYRFEEGEVVRMRTLEARVDLGADDRIHLCFALGKALEDRANHADSWRYYERGNALKRATSGYRPEVIESNTRGQIAVCTREFFTARAGWGAGDRSPIFIVGLPRSGSTLIEQILASHSAVEGTEELADVHRIVLELQGREPNPDDPRYPRVLSTMTAAEFRRLGERYLTDTLPYRTGRPHFIDKMPNNFRHIGLIHLMLPNAKVIDARREPMACCFGNLKQLFANGQEFSYSIDDIARYYRTYLELMRHWDAVLPGKVLRVLHEEVVEDLEGSARRILDFCELPFETACLEFYRSGRSVRTPSAEQVRRPIYRDGLNQWKHYEPWLDALRDALGDALTRYREPVAGHPL
ncbi:MAG: sulfotransferase [Gammaproteobacteria bacterium]|nr:sulfotransferase [Gammaproteobacteria bacterium]